MRKLTETIQTLENTIKSMQAVITRQAEELRALRRIPGPQLGLAGASTTATAGPPSPSSLQLQESFITNQEDNTAWMANIANWLTALEKRQGTQEANMCRVHTQLNGLLASNPGKSASADQSPIHHGSTN